MTETDEYPPDFGDDPSQKPYVFEKTLYQHPRPMYTHTGRVAHVVDGDSDNDLQARCGVGLWNTWYGTGSMKEIVTAHALPLCKKCTRLMYEGDLERDMDGEL